MKRIFLFSMLVAGLFCACNNTPKPLQLTADNIDVILDSLTLEEKVHLLVGTGMAGFSGDSAVVGATKNLVPGAAGTTYPIPRLGIPSIVLADGPAGLRIQPTREGDSATYYCTAFPVATLLSSTWNTELVENVGNAMGNEVLEYGADVLLAPALNIHRNPLCGRNFEYYSEDPLLSGKTAAAIVRGVQSNGVGTSIKHFAVNNQETNRQRNDAIVSQRALREIYLRGFEIAVKESQPWTVMTSYNKINGTAASESGELLTDILRGEWGFAGAVMTDWFGGYNAVNQMIAGNDLLMPGRPDQYEMIVEAVKSGKLDVEFINKNVRRMLELIVKSPRFKGYKFTNKPDLKAHAEVTRQSALEGMVLLENRDNTLPLNNVKKIAAFGITSYDFIAGGTGSGDVNEAYTISLGEGLNNAGYEIDSNLKALYDNHIAAENEKNKPDPKNPFAMFMPKIRAAELVPDAKTLAQTVENNDVALITVGRTSGEFEDRKTADFYLNEKEISLVKNVCEAFHKAGKKAVVILNIGGVIETATWKNLPDAVLLAWQAGQEGGNSVADILRGAANPSGKLPMTFPVKLEDVPSYANFPRNYTPANPMETMMGGNVGENRKNIDFTKYEEGVFAGYRYYLTENKAVSYPFGYGLSYTTFEYGTPEVSGKDGNFTVKISVKNTDTVAGKSVVELYISAPNSTRGALNPTRELKAFAKTKLLVASESQVLELKLTPADFASFDEVKTAWIAAAGDYKIEIGSSAAEILQSVSVNLPHENEVERTHNVLNIKK
jgi:beta-glucosidase